MPQVDKFEVERVARVKGEVVGGGEVVVKLVWLNGPETHYILLFVYKKINVCT